MGLILKESNCPFWVIGITKNGTINNSNIQCYSKSKKKQNEMAEKCLKDNNKVNEVYLLSGADWDHMPNSGKEASAFVKTKGKLLMKRENIKTEGEYPKGVSLEPLPKKGAKVYTSVATSLECKDDDEGLELKETKDNKITDAQDEFDHIMGNFKFSDIIEMITKDNEYNAKINYEDSYKSFLEPIVKEYDHQDNPEGLAEYYKKTDFGSISIFINYNKNANPAENGWDKDIETIEIKIENNKKEESLKESKDLNKVINKAIKVLQNEEDEPRLKLINDLAKMDKYDITQDESKKISKILKDGEKIANTDKCIDKLKKLKESKIVQPVGNPQTANAFVNIDIDLDHMEVSDFIIRLSQAIRSEQQAILEYTALRSANGITNEDRSVIDAIIEEEKNHMVSISALLYKQMLLNHSENVDKAREEFVLPTFGQQDVIDEDNKLTESLSNIIGKILKESNSLTEDINFNVDDSNMSKTIYNVEADVNYDEDFVVKVADNVKIAVNSYNEITGQDNYGADPETVQVGAGKLKLSVLTFNGFADYVDDKFLQEYLSMICKQASNYEYFIELK